jgi:hypothetical protein
MEGWRNGLQIQQLYNFLGKYFQGCCFFAPFFQLRNWIFRSFDLRLNVTICQVLLKKITNKWFSSKQYIMLPFCISCIYFKYVWQVLLTKFISQWGFFFEVVHDIFFYIYTMSHKCHKGMFAWYVFAYSIWAYLYFWYIAYVIKTFLNM